MGRKSSEDKRRKGKDKAREKFARNGKNTSRGVRFKERMLEKRANAQVGKEMNKNGKRSLSGGSVWVGGAGQRKKNKRRG